MSTSSAKGRAALVGGADVFDADLLPWPEYPASPLAAVVGDYYWGTGVTDALSPVEIPYAWIATPLARKPTTPVNAVTVSQTGGTTASALDQASIDRFGSGGEPVTLDTACDADPANLAEFLVEYEATPRPRQPLVRLVLHGRTDAEVLRILRVKLGQRVRIPDAPAFWPPGAANLVVEGIAHRLAVEDRAVVWATSALIGVAPTEPGPWWRWDASTWDGTDLVPF